MTRLEHGHGGPHAYVVAGEADPHAGPMVLDHGHGGAHAYVTARQRTAARDEDFLGQLTFHHSTWGSGREMGHSLYAHHPEGASDPVDNYAGRISWWDKDGEVAGVHVHPDFQRRGVATELWQRARAISPHIRHSRDQTPEGNAWARTTTGRLLDATRTGPLYHGTSAEGLSDVLPASQHGRETFSGLSSPDHAYATSDLAQARQYADLSSMIHGGRPRVYEVHHLGPEHELEPDPGYAPDVRSRHGFGVTRELRPGEIPPTRFRTATRRTSAAKNQPVCPSCRDWVSYAVPGGWEHVDGTPMCPQVGSGTCSCCGGTGEHLCGHECYACDASGEHESDQPCPGHHGTVDDRPGHSSAERVHIEATLSRLAFLPTKRLFGPTYGLDTRLFDGDHLKPDVRRYILETLGDFWKPRHGVTWDEWAVVYLAGSEASEWTSETLQGNGDFDVLIGVDYEAYRKNSSRTDPAQHMTDEEITAELNAHLKKLTAQTDPTYIVVDGKSTGPWSNTWYINQDSHDIRKIKPYAAYDVTHDRWAVKPPHLPTWDISQFPEGPALVAEAEAVSAYVQAILAMPEPYRTQQGYALWHHLHSDRSRAFSEHGEGWYDPGNVIEKWLDQEGLWEKLVEIMVRVKNDPSTMNAPKNWSNNPG